MFGCSQRIKATFLSPFYLKKYVHTHTYVFVYTYICVCIYVWTLWTIWLQVNAIKGKFFNFLAKGIKIHNHPCCSCYCCCCRYYQCAQQSNWASNAATSVELPQKLPCFVFCCISFFFSLFLSSMTPNQLRWHNATIYQKHLWLLWCYLWSNNKTTTPPTRSHELCGTKKQNKNKWLRFSSKIFGGWTPSKRSRQMKWTDFFFAFL